MKGRRRVPGGGVWGLVLATMAGLAQVSFALAQGTTIYKCTDASGRTAFSDKPCATAPSGAAGGAGSSRDSTKQEVLRAPASPAANTGADTTAALCAKPGGSKPTDEIINALPPPQQDAVIGVLRGLIAGMGRDAAQRQALQRVTLRVDASRTAIICVPRQRARAAGAESGATAYVAFQVEPNGRMVTLQPSAPPIVYNDANAPTTAAARCSGLITSCVMARGGPPDAARSIDECFAAQTVCPVGRLDLAAACCPQACKDAYRKARAAGIDAETAMIRVIFGDRSGAVSCIPGMPRKG